MSMNRFLSTYGEISSLSISPYGNFVGVAFKTGKVGIIPLDDDGETMKQPIIIDNDKTGKQLPIFRNHIEITSDGRFLFSGVLRGCTDLIAVDLASVQRKRDDPGSESDSESDECCIYEPKSVAMYSHSDAKLRGFGAATVVQNTANQSSHYRLLCGMGITRIHVWSFELSREKKSKWTCNRDIRMNGMSIEILGFGLNENCIYSKSECMCVRMWDFNSSDDERDYKEVPNSHDVKGIFGDFAYGGQYSLCMISLTADAASNRTEIVLSGGPNRDKKGAIRTRQRHCRTIEQVYGTPDGSHILLQCSDGNIFYHQHHAGLKLLDTSHLKGVKDGQFALAVSLLNSTIPVYLFASSTGDVKMCTLPKFTSTSRVSPTSEPPNISRAPRISEPPCTPKIDATPPFRSLIDSPSRLHDPIDESANCPNEALILGSAILSPEVQSDFPSVDWKYNTGPEIPQHPAPLTPPISLVTHSLTSYITPSGRDRPPGMTPKMALKMHKFFPYISNSEAKRRYLLAHSELWDYMGVRYCDIAAENVELQLNSNHINKACVDGKRESSGSQCDARPHKISK